MNIKNTAFSLLISFIVFGAVISSPNSSANSEILQFENDKQSETYHQLINELRCPKCQNQNIADSNAELAVDLRNKVYEMTTANKDKSEIKQFMTDRFGEFVLYKPKFSMKTALLWLGPVLLLFLALFFCLKLILKNAAKLNSED